MITTRSKELADKIKSLRTHGITKDPKLMSRNDGGWFMEMQELGFNGRISDILCALGSSQLKRMDTNLMARRKIAQRYQEAFSDLPIKLPELKGNVEHAFHLYVIHVKIEKNCTTFSLLKNSYSGSLHTYLSTSLLHQTLREKF